MSFYRLILSAFPLFIIQFAALAQSEGLSTKDVFKTGPITWLGIDFTHATITDTTVANSDLINKFIPDWNDIVLRESDKFRFNKTLHRSNVIYAPEVTKGINSAIEGNLRVGMQINTDTIKAILRRYDMKGNVGIGFILIVDSLTKYGKARAVVWCAFVDMKERNLLYLKRVEGKPSGFGFRNYWSNAFSSIFTAIGDKWQKWRAEELGK